MKKYLAVIILACCLTACGSGTGADDNSATPKETTTTTAVTTAEESSEPEATESEPEETTTTTKATESEPEPEETESKAEETTTTTKATEEPAPAVTYNTAWHERYTINSVIGVDTHVYSAPTKDSEPIGDLKAGDVVVNVGYSDAAPDMWAVIQWNNGVGFLYALDISGVVDDAPTTEPVQDDTVYDGALYDNGDPA